MSESFYNIGNIMAIAPPKNLTNPNSHSSSKFKWYCMSVVCVMLIAYVLSTMGRVRDVYPHFPIVTLIVTDLALSIALTVGTLSAIIIPCLCCTSKYIKFIVNFRRVDKFLHNIRKLKSRRCNGFCFILGLGHVVMIMFFAYDGYVQSTKLGIVKYRSYLLSVVQAYYSCAIVMMVSGFAKALQYRFEYAIDILKEVNSVNAVKENVGILNEINMGIASHRSNVNMEQIMKLFDILYEQLTLFNKLFGGNFFFLSLVSLAGLLNCINVLTVYIIKQNYQEMSFQLDLIILNCCWSLLPLVLEIILAVSCDGAPQEAQRTVDVCYKLLLNLPPVLEKLQDRTLHVQLHLLAQMCSQRCPTLLSGGYLKVDCSMLLALFGAITSYVIVMIQFNS